MVLANLRTMFRGRYDAFFYEDRIVLRRVPGIDAERVGLAVGLVLGWIGAIFGAWVGRRIAARGNARRICPIEWVGADQVASSDTSNRVVQYWSIVHVEARLLPGGGVLRLREGDGRTTRLRWHAVHNPNTDAIALLRAAIGSRVAVRRRRVGRVLTIAAASVIAVLLTVGLAAAFTL